MEYTPIELEKVVESLMDKRGIELKSAIENLRNENLQKQAMILKKKLPLEGRCPICTLKIPCKHYQKMQNFDTGNNLFENTRIATPDSVKSSYLSITPGRSYMKIRYKGRKEQSESPKPVPESDELEKLQLMERLERYKAEKLQREIQLIEEIKRIEENEKEKLKELEKKREIYHFKQKAKLKYYQKDLKNRIEEMERKRQDFEELEKIHIKVQKKVHNEQKKKLIDYKLKKQLYSEIIDSQVDELVSSAPKINSPFKSLKELKPSKVHF